VAGVRAFRFNAVITEELMRAGEGAAGLPGIASGELITAVAMTEPGIGSELASMTTTAVRGHDDEGDHYLVNGSKTFITNGINAGLVITAVKTDPAQRHRASH
jgi:alkylation response protein AidB-like acyl-CoA dehydrogenase